MNSSKYGGMEWHVYDLVRGMVSEGHNVFVWCPQGEMAENFKNAGAVVTYEDVKRDIDRKYIKRLSSFLSQNEIDVVHSHELKAVSNTLLACKKANIKVRVTHTHTPISEWKIGKIKKGLNTRFYSFMVNRYSSAEIALTESKKRVKMKEGIEEKKLVVIPNCLDTSKYDISPLKRSEYEEEIKKKHNIPKNAFIFGNVGRLTEEKDHETLVRAFAKFLESDLFHKRDFYLLIVGGGPLEGKIKDLANSLNLDNRVIITGVFEESEKAKYYSAFDTFIFPTFAEGFGIVLIEALYMGLPTICSDLEVLREVGDDVVEYFEVGNALDLTKKMISEYNKIGDDGKVISDRSKSYVENSFSTERFINEYQNLYERLLKEKEEKK